MVRVLHSQTQYIGNFIYENGVLTKVLTPEGYLRISSTGAWGWVNGVYKVITTYTPEYNYFLRDHLGNTRAQLIPSGSTMAVVYNKYYYPFGMEYSDPCGEYYGLTSPSTNPYLYNGKELDRMHGLNWYDYGARWKDLGWTSVDPLCEKYYWISPYAYCAGNPVRYVDPTGMEIAERSKVEWIDNKKDIIGKMSDLAKNGKFDEIEGLQGTLLDMKACEKSTDVYSLSATTKDIGGVNLDVKSGEIVIAYEGTANFVHEVTHAGQYEKGEIGFDKKTGNPIAMDLWDETAAYKAQYNYDPYSVKGVDYASEITPNFVKGIKDTSGKNLYSSDGLCHTGQSPLNANSGGLGILYAYPNDKKIVGNSLEMIMHHWKLSDLPNSKFKTK